MLGRLLLGERGRQARKEGETGNVALGREVYLSVALPGLQTNLRWTRYGSRRGSKEELGDFHQNDKQGRNCHLQRFLAQGKSQRGPPLGISGPPFPGSKLGAHRINVHCTITRQLLQRPDYLSDFADFGSKREEVQRIWFSLYTPQDGEHSQERLTPLDRRTVLDELARLRTCFAKIEMPDRVLEGYFHPRVSPQECIFAQTTTCISADLTARILPCQFGGRPVRAECGCIASAGPTSFGRYELAGLVKVSDLLAFSKTVGGHFGHGAQVRNETAYFERADFRSNQPAGRTQHDWRG